MKNIKYIAVALIFFAAGFFLGQSFKGQPNLSLTDNNQAIVSQTGQVTYALKFSDNDLTEYQDVKIEAKETVLHLLQRLTAENNIVLETKDYGALGLLVAKIGDKANGQDNKYWQFYINNTHPEVGAGNYQLTGGERVEWRFEEDNYNKK